MPESFTRDWRTPAIVALATLVMVFSGFYLDNVNSTLDALRYDQTVTEGHIKALSERTTTLEESKRNSEQWMVDIKEDLEFIKRELRK